jgi:manganese transport system ATP-binding protein
MMPDVVAAEDLVVEYETTVALSASTFSVPAGRVTAVIGPNGSGKSTLLNVIAGLVEPTRGRIVVGDGPRRQGRISYVLQSTKVNDSLPVSVREVVTMGRYAQLGSHRRLQAEDRAAVTEAMDRMGISNLAGRHISTLSGGQRQRAFVAQGLAQDHDLLLLDEPLTGIDITTAQAIDDVIHDEVKRGCSVILTTHDLSEATVADHVVLLSGRVVASGSPRAVLTTENLVTAYGPALLHVEEGRVFVDDAAHMPADGRHLHRDRVIHTESEPGSSHPQS